MKAIIKNKTASNFTSSHRKENNVFYEYSAIVKTDAFLVPVTIRLYSTKSGGSNTAALWVNDSSTGTHINSTGSASGYGYHRPSAAAAQAFKKAGIELSEDIDGRGDNAIERAVKAVAVSLGYSEGQIYIHKANS